MTALADPQKQLLCEPDHEPVFKVTYPTPKTFQDFGMPETYDKLVCERCYHEKPEYQMNVIRLVHLDGTEVPQVV